MNKMSFQYVYPKGMENLKEFLMSLLFVRNYNKQEDTKFTKVDSGTPSKIIYDIVHKVPPILRALIQMDLQEVIDVSHMDDKDDPYIHSVISSKGRNSLTIDTITYYRVVDGLLHCQTDVMVEYQKRSIPKLLHAPVMEWTQNRTDAVRKCEIKMMHDLFPHHKISTDWKHVSVKSSSDFQ